MIQKRGIKKLNRAAALSVSEKRYRTLVETMGDGLSEIDESRLATYANDRLCDMWGYSRDEIIGRSVADFLDKENRKILNEQLAKRRKGENDPYEIVWARKDGTKIHTIMTPTPYFDASGNFKGSFAVITDISKHKKERELLEQAHIELEHRVTERTIELEIKTKSLEEVNTALRVLLKKREEDKEKLEERMLQNVRELIIPYIERLRKSRLNNRQRAFTDIMESTLNDIVSPFLHRISSRYLNLTPSEIQVANLVKNGNTTKEIAEILGLSSRTIATYRRSIRKKIGITNKSVNLRTKLASIQ